MTTEFNKNDALMFIAGLDVPQVDGIPADAPDLGFDKAKQQALAVGSDVISFDEGVPAEFREAVSDSALLAQLAIDKKLGRNADPIAYFDAYFEILARLGWVTQVWDVAQYEVTTKGATVHEAIIKIVEAFLEGAPGALKLVMLTLNSLQAMGENSKQLRLFQRNTQDAKIGRFQFTTVHQDEHGGLFAEVMAFTLDAEERITKVLLFDFNKAKSKLQRKLGSMSLNRTALATVLPAVRQKIGPQIEANVAEIEI